MAEGERRARVTSVAEPPATEAVAQTANAAEEPGSSLGTAALVGIAVAVIEPELIPGMLIGAGAVMVPKIFPKLGSALRPLFKGAVKAGYAGAVKVRELAAEATEQVQDIVAEAKAEREAGMAAPPPRDVQSETPHRPARKQA